jgi:cell shape-determining protein MreC
MKWIATFIVVLCCCAAPLFGQDYEQAQSRLEAKADARRTAATQPAPVTNAQYQALQAELLRLKAENARLVALIAKLQGKPTSVPTTQAAKVKSLDDDNLKVGMTEAECEAMADAAKWRKEVIHEEGSERIVRYSSPEIWSSGFREWEQVRIVNGKVKSVTRNRPDARDYGN